MPNATVNTKTFPFSPRQGSGTVQLVADIHPQVAWTLRETPLSEDQQLAPLPDSDWMRLTASVPDDQETLGWVMGLGGMVLIHQPETWAQRIRLHEK